MYWNSTDRVTAHYEFVCKVVCAVFNSIADHLLINMNLVVKKFELGVSPAILRLHTLK